MDSSAFDKYLPYIDVNDGTKRLMGNRAIYLSIIQKFDSAGLVEAVTKAAEAHDYEALRIAAHTLKGAAANLSLSRFQEISAKIEESAKTGEAPDSLLDELQSVFSFTSKAISELVSET